MVEQAALAAGEKVRWPYAFSITGVLAVICDTGFDKGKFAGSVLRIFAANVLFERLVDAFLWVDTVYLNFGYNAMLASSGKTKIVEEYLYGNGVSCRDSVEEVFVSLPGRCSRHVPCSHHGSSAARAKERVLAAWHGFDWRMSAGVEQELEPHQCGFPACVQESIITNAVKPRRHCVLEEAADELHAIQQR